MAEKVGVFLPTYNRPDLLRACLLQWIVQSRCPDFVVIHQNGSSESYEWCISDLKSFLPCEWIFSPQTLPAVEWYRRPLQRLIEAGCTHFFWADHDDIYLTHHVEARLNELDYCDFSISDKNSILFHRAGQYRFQPLVHFTSHPAGGMSSSMAFTRPFAEALHQAFLDTPDASYADHVVLAVTRQGFDCRQSDKRTAIYVSHDGSFSSHIWLEDVFSDTPP